MKWLTFISLALCLPIVSYAADDRNQPGSILNEGVETFSIACAGMPQETTLDMDACMDVQLKQLSWVKDKYLARALNRLQQDNKDSPPRLQELTRALNDESQAWDTLIDKAAASTKADSAGGTISTVSISLRQIGLIELQIHDIWDHWLRFEDTTPPLLPEPKFKSAS